MRRSEEQAARNEVSFREANERNSRMQDDFGQTQAFKKEGIPAAIAESDQ